MRRSLRWRVQAWYAAVLLLVIAGFAGFLYQRVREARFREIDTKLNSGAKFLDANLRAFPPHMLEGPPPDFLIRPPPPVRNPEQFFGNLELPEAGPSRG